MIFTLPHELNPIWLLNVRKMTNLFFTCVRDTLFEFFLDSHYHMIFTLPHELNPIWLLNVRKMTNLFFTCVRDVSDRLRGTKDNRVVPT